MNQERVNEKKNPKTKKRLIHNDLETKNLTTHTHSQSFTKHTYTQWIFFK